MKRLATRQVHLDFHTSELIPGVGSRFSKENFQSALKLGHLNSITVFAKCHHSWCYYPTKVGMMHPALDFDLTGAMVEAAHEIGVRAPIYITTGWSARDAENHPEWLARNRDGSLQLSNYDLNARPEDKKPIVSWKVLCLAGPYAQYIYELTREVTNRYPAVDGLFFDICFFHDQCYCAACVEGMGKLGLNPEHEQDAKKYYVLMRQALMRNCADILQQRHPKATVFFNGGADQNRPQYHDLQTHFELEDLPTTWGGYDKMPPRAKFFARTGKDYLGMTGKFHTTWGEFGGYKTPAALKYECAAMLTYGARCSVGDQMHPSGEMEPDTYRAIGTAYAYVQQIEDYCYDVEETTRLGIVPTTDGQSYEGFVRMLLETQMDFAVVLPEDDLSGFDAVILPDSVLLDDAFAARLNTFIANGGGVLLTGESGLNQAKNKFLLDVGANYLGVPQYAIDYVRAGHELSEGIVQAPFLFYEGACQIGKTDSKTLAWIREPYFDRTYGHYCSHQNTPYKLEDAANPAAVRKGKVIYLAHKLGKMYFQHGAQYHRDYLINALRLVYGNPVMQVCLPSSGRARLVRQPSENRYVMHLLYGSPVQRGRTSVIEDLPPIYNIPVSVRVPEQVQRILLVPQQEAIQFVQQDNILKFTVPEVLCHQALILAY